MTRRLSTFVLIVSVLAHLSNGQEVDYMGCDDGSRLCVGHPANCFEQNRRNCDILFKAVFDVRGQRMLAEMFGRVTVRNRYVAVALSTDNLMGADSVSDCSHLPDGTIRQRNGYNTPRTVGNAGLRYQVNANIRGIQNIVAAIDSNVIHCAWTRQNSITHDGQTWFLAGNGFFILLAEGPINPATGAPMRHDSVTRFSKKVFFPPNLTPTTSTQRPRFYK